MRRDNNDDHIIFPFSGHQDRKSIFKERERERSKEVKNSFILKSDGPARPLSKASTLYPALESLRVPFSKTLISALLKLNASHSMTPLPTPVQLPEASSSISGFFYAWIQSNVMRALNTQACNTLWTKIRTAGKEGAGSDCNNTVIMNNVGNNEWPTCQMNELCGYSCALLVFVLCVLHLIYNKSQLCSVVPCDLICMASSPDQFLYLWGLFLLWWLFTFDKWSCFCSFE